MDNQLFNKLLLIKMIRAHNQLFNIPLEDPESEIDHVQLFNILPKDQVLAISNKYNWTQHLATELKEQEEANSFSQFIDNPTIGVKQYISFDGINVMIYCVKPGDYRLYVSFRPKPKMIPVSESEEIGVPPLYDYFNNVFSVPNGFTYDKKENDIITLGIDTCSGQDYQIDYDYGRATRFWTEKMIWKMAKYLCKQVAETINTPVMKINNSFKDVLFVYIR